MSEMQLTSKERFTDVFDARVGYPEGDYDIDADREKYLTSSDETVMWTAPDVESWGACHYPEFHDHQGWSMGYAEIDESTQAVYVFQTGSIWAVAKQLVIDADKLEAVADVLETTPADVANRIQCYRTYPALIETNDHATILIAPIANADVETDD